MRRRQLWRSADGAVSIYLIVSTAAMLLVTSLLIDFARIAAFQKQSELAAQSGIRSALSAYDGELYEQYGLFGAGGTDRNEWFARAAELNLQSDESRFSLLRGRIEAAHVNGYEVLGNHAVFTRQVLEEMKYKAPIDFTLEVASKFAPLSSSMKEASMSVELLERVRQLYDEREKRLQEVLALQKAMAEVAKSSLEPQVQSAGGVASGYSSYVRWRMEDAMLGPDEEPIHTASIHSYRNSAYSTSSTLKANSSHVLQNHRDKQQQAEALLEEAERLNEAMKTAIQRMREEGAGDGFDRINRKQLPGGEGGGSGSNSQGDLTAFGEARVAAEGLLLEPAWFETYRLELRHQTADMGRVDAAAADFEQAVSAALSGYGSALAEASQQLEQDLRAYTVKYIQPGTVIEARQSQSDGRQANDRERKSNEAAAKSKLSEVRQLIQAMASASSQKESQEAFQDVQKRMEANLRFNEAAEAQLDESNRLTGAGEEAGEEARLSMASIGTIFSGMADQLEGIRDPLYLNEYIVNRFQSFDPKLFGHSGGGEWNQSAFSSALALENQEAEYILYGFHSPAANVAAAYGELFSLRLAIRTMEGFIECRALGHPLLVLSAAVLYGLEKAAADLAAIAQKGSVELSKYAPVELSYKDYLRVFLILHGGGASRTARMIAVIERNRGVTLASVPTGLTGELTTSVNLWFLPGLMKSFTLTGALGGKVKNNRYEATHTIGWSYG
ncbi:coiled-coil domain-containing protein [Paenibacillus silvisoli]|uniref:hypothetical protein n=1 Tax=Paenibacillus silvisoli TaxID=3110539 RepID=UPI002804F805|nr:hypothetical protein [Paenibacillus silvisoli]